MPDSDKTVDLPPMRSESYGDEAKALSAGRSFWENRAALTRQTESMHVGYSDAAGAGRRARTDAVIGIAILAAIMYAAVVALVIAALDLPLGWTWLAAAVVAMIAVAIIRLAQARLSHRAGE
jgi:hypothetical protein